MPKLYTIYKKYEKRMKYASYIPPEKHETVFDFLKSCEKSSDYTLFLVSKYKYYLKEGTFVNYDTGIVVLKDSKKNTTHYEYMKNHYLFVENKMSMVKEDQLEKYAPIRIELDDEKKERKKEKKGRKGDSMRSTFESILETIEEVDEDEWTLIFLSNDTIDSDL